MDFARDGAVGFSLAAVLKTLHFPLNYKMAVAAGTNSQDQWKTVVKTPHLWQHHKTSLWRNAPLQFVTYGLWGELRRAFDAQHDFSTNFLAGATSGVLVMTLMQPLNAIVRMQLRKENTSIRSLYRGFTLTIAGVGFYRGFVSGTYFGLTSTDSSVLCQAGAAFAATFMAHFLTQPLDSIRKKYLFSATEKKNMLELFKKTHLPSPRASLAHAIWTFPLVVLWDRLRTPDE
jgi:hypothetical protein